MDDTPYAVTKKSDVPVTLALLPKSSCLPSFLNPSPPPPSSLQMQTSFPILPIVQLSDNQVQKFNQETIQSRKRERTQDEFDDELKAGRKKKTADLLMEFLGEAEEAKQWHIQRYQQSLEPYHKRLKKLGLRKE
eukprot:TRINITY_DN13762_c0_g1_i1.p1 TRINITY_DN13762_c0_g1~~TRINITY_DN13762_c0_g1_i1.p1  ORF type:complete len:134 (+),score=39.51 TRINITY_DN13762_c0_g1_i1:170-571(+)